MDMIAQNQVVMNIYREIQQRFAHMKDPAHGWEHIERVYNLALWIAEKEEADPFIVGIAALLHDVGRLEKHPERPHAEVSVEISRSLLSVYLLEIERVEAILHAVEAHSYSHGIEPQTLEARVVRDADRLDGLGAIGILRWAITGAVKRGASTRTYHPEDPFAEQHQLDDRQYMLDHFYTKLLKLEETMVTETGRILARRRSAYMRGYLQEFKSELELLHP